MTEFNVKLVMSQAHSSHKRARTVLVWALTCPAAPAHKVSSTKRSSATRAVILQTPEQDATFH